MLPLRDLSRCFLRIVKTPKGGRHGGYLADPTEGYARYPQDEEVLSGEQENRTPRRFMCRAPGTGYTPA